MRDHPHPDDAVPGFGPQEGANPSPLGAPAPSPSKPRPLVLLHGLGQSPIAWQDFVSAFGAGRSMNAPWMRGLKPGDPVGFDLAAAAHGVANDIELQGIRQADFLGVSIGASVALRLAVERPELVGRLVIGGALVRPSNGAIRLQKLAMRVVPESKLVDAGVSRPRMLAVLDALKGFDGRESLRQVTAPALVVAGSKDKAGVVAARALAAELPDSRVEVIPGAGALLNTDSARELAALAHAFLDLPPSG
ncbi:MAG: alpha/beta hydrolase [Terracoccus sp.]